MEDTISAIATALGVGAVGIIRVSGPGKSPSRQSDFSGKRTPFLFPSPLSAVWSYP